MHARARSWTAARHVNARIAIVGVKKTRARIRKIEKQFHNAACFVRAFFTVKKEAHEQTNKNSSNARARRLFTNAN